MKKAVAVTLAILAVWSVIILVGRGKKAGTEYGPDSDGVAVERPGDRSFKKAALREIEAAIASWPQQSQTAAHRLIEKYGVPDEVGRKRLVWNDNGPWKRTVVHREAGRDVIEQVASYHINNDRYELVGKLPGQVSAERGREEIASRANSEALNFLALNLADEVLSGKRQLDDAANAYARTAELAAAGKSSPYTQSLLFAEPPPAAAAPRAKTGGRQ